VGQFSDFLENEDILPISINNKHEFHNAISNIRNSWSGRADIYESNTFIMEAAKTLINSIRLFELGYFDAAYYSLRSSIEVSTTVMYLADIPDLETRKEKLKSWNEVGFFPDFSRMITYLKSNGTVYQDLSSIMPEYLDGIVNLNRELNKYVHKQGYGNLYVSANHPLYTGMSLEDRLNTYEQYLKQTIGIVGFMRLVVDPMPVLLRDEEIVSRLPSSFMTEAYCDNFISDYIGELNVKNYVKTKIYKIHYDYFVQFEKKPICIVDIIQDNHVDTRKKSEILENLKFLDINSKICTRLILSCDKVCSVISENSSLSIWSERYDIGIGLGWSSRLFKDYRQMKDGFNISQDKYFLSFIDISDIGYILNHNEHLTGDDIENIMQVKNTL